MYYGKTSYLETWGDEEEKPMAHIPEQETYEGELEEIPVNDEEKPESTIIKSPPEPRKITPAEIDRFFLSLNGNVFTAKDIQTALGAENPNQKSSIYGRISVLLEKGAIRKLGPIPGSRTIQYELTDKYQGQTSGPPQSTDTVKIGKIPGIDTVVHKGPMIKICHDCQKPLPIDEFQRNNRSKDGLLHICIKCHKERTNIPSPGKADHQLNIQIDDYPWIIARLKTSGKLLKNLRTWPQQALVYILQGLEKDGITGEE